MQISTQVPAEASGDSTTVAIMRIIEHTGDVAHVAAANVQLAADSQLAGPQELLVLIHIFNKICNLSLNQSHSIAAELCASTIFF